MTKYVRTKDGIFEVKREETLCGVKFYDIEMGDYSNRIREEFVIKESDTIEELCDEFHIEYESLSFHRKINYVKYHYFESAKNNLVDGDTLYGVIQIKGKGLIYVAKMNKEGDLVLI